MPPQRQGTAQAEAIAARLRPMRFTAVYASDLRRVTQTARRSCRGRDVPLVTLPALRERGFGEWEGLTFTDGGSLPGTPTQRCSLGTTPARRREAESERQLYERVAPAWTACWRRTARRRQPADGRARRLAVRGDRAPAGAAVRQHGALLIGHCGLSIVTVYEGGFAALDLMNDRNHLESEP